VRIAPTRPRIAKVSLLLMRCCTVMWTLITLDHCGTWAAAVYLGDAYGTGAKRPQWAFLLDTALDVTAKLLFAHVIASAHSHVPHEAERQQARWIREAMDTVWASSRDTVVLSEMRADSSVRTIASNALCQLIGDPRAKEWASWRTTKLNANTKHNAPDSEYDSNSWSSESESAGVEGRNSSASVARVRGTPLPAHEAFAQLIADAWHWSVTRPAFTTIWHLGPIELLQLGLGGGGGGGSSAGDEGCDGKLRQVEVQISRVQKPIEGMPVSTTVTFLILTLRDITERVRV
jgi:hypothetical protein